MRGAEVRRLLGAFAGAVVLACGSPAATEPQDVRVLVFTRTEAFRHASIEPAVTAFRDLAEGAGLELDATEDPSAFEAANLARYRAVVFLLTTGDVLDEPEQDALMDFVRGGGGFVGVHSASDTEYDWPWYEGLVGAYVAGHPSDPGVRTGTLHVAEADHPATAALPAAWTRADEWYDLRELQPGLTVLLNIDESSYKRPEEGPLPDPRPIAWCREYDGGRTFYTALGHTSDSYAEPLFLEHLWGGLTWVMDG